MNIHGWSPSEYVPVIDIVDRCPGAMPHSLPISLHIRLKILETVQILTYYCSFLREKFIDMRCVCVCVWGGGATQTYPLYIGKYIASHSI